MAPLTPLQRLQVVQLYHDLKSTRRVAKQLGLAHKTVCTWVTRYKVHKTVDSKAGRGRKRVLDQQAAATAIELLLSNQYDTAQDVAKKLKSDGLTRGTTVPHRTTVVRHAKAAAEAAGTPFRAVRGKPGKELTANTRAKRLAFCKANSSRNWGTVMFTDRKKFLFQYPGTRVRRVQWLKKGETRTAFKPNHPMGLNVYAGITKWGVTKFHIVSGSSGYKSQFRNKKGQQAKNITSDEYKQVLTKTLLPEGKRMFASQGISHWILQQDNDPTHKKASQEAVAAWNLEHPGSVVDVLQNWPPNSPDLSPIENLWADIQQIVDSKGCATFAEFKVEVTKCLNNVPRSKLLSLYNSMRSRLVACQDLEGKKTKY